ncbi:MAG: hypothetical protein FJ313_04575 [Gemmatimonadetes bacterium]|nr:hypothetical protein [Gemmatimonadota bacterium]
MDFNATSAAGASVTASVMVLAVFYAFVLAVPRHLPLNWLYVLGSALVGLWTTRRAPTCAAGLALQLALAVLLSFVFARLYQALGIHPGGISFAAWGFVAGGIFWLFAGALLPILDNIHPLIHRGGLRLLGPYARNYGIPTVAALWLANMAFGALLGHLYQAW